MMPFRTDVGRVAAALPSPLLRVGQGGRVVWRNERCRALTEGNGPTMLGRPLRELVRPRDRGLVEAALIGLDGGAATAGVHVRIRVADGSSAEGRLKFQSTPPFEDHPGFVTVLLCLDDE